MRKLKLLAAMLAVATIWVGCNPDDKGKTVEPEPEPKPSFYMLTVGAIPVAGGTAGATIDGKGEFKTTLSVEEGAKVTVFAKPAEGYLFDGWTVEGLILSPDAASATATFTMPAGDVAVSAAFSEKPEETDDTVTVDFEEAVLFEVTGAEGYTDIFWGIELAEEDDIMGLLFDGILYSESGANFGGYYTDMGGIWETWGGFAVSSNNDMQADGVANQFSAYALEVSKFAMAYDSGGMMGGTYERPAMTFDKPVEVVSAMFANSTWAYLYCTDADFAGYYTVVATGYNGGEETQTVNIELVKDGRVVSDWTEFDLSPLGTVDAIKFTVDSDDAMLPYYFCIDDLKFIPSKL